MFGCVPGTTCRVFRDHHQTAWSRCAQFQTLSCVLDAPRQAFMHRVVQSCICIRVCSAHSAAPSAIALVKSTASGTRLRSSMFLDCVAGRPDPPSMSLHQVALYTSACSGRDAPLHTVSCLTHAAVALIRSHLVRSECNVCRTKALQCILHSLFSSFAGEHINLPLTRDMLHPQPTLDPELVGH